MNINIEPNTRLVFGVLGLCAIAVICLALSLFSGCIQKQAMEPEQQYLVVQGGNRSSIFLIESRLSFGTYDRDVSYPYPDSSYPRKGDPAVIIQGTLRSDYEEDLYISLSANLYDGKGQQVGRVVSPSSAKPWFVVLHVPAGSTEPFRVYVDYDGTDVARYELFLYGSPAKWPAP